MTVEGTGADPEIARIRERIDALIKSRLPDQKVYYLSQLGAQLGEDRKLLEKLTGTKFAQFVRDNFPYEIGATGLHQNVLYVRIPGGVVEPSSMAPPRYIPRFWAAFAIPLRPNDERYINLDTCDFGSKETVATKGADVRRIDPNFIAPHEASGSAAETAERISKWLQAEKLDGERFHLRARRSRAAHESLLEQILAALDREQLRRVNLPLDVIKSLADRCA